MFGRRFELFRIFGFAVRIDLSWFIIAILVTWSLAESWFPVMHAGLETTTYWWMGVAGALGLFASIILHECSHALVARQHGLPIRGITLFIFGGIAEMEGEPSSPRVEFAMASAGPLASILIAGLCLALSLAGESAGWPVPVTGVLAWLAWMNGILVAFNLIPAFPLDGGRVLRSALWRWRRNLRWATRVASRIGSGFGIVLIGFGIYLVLRNAFITGMWLFLIGMFLRGAAQMSYQQLLMRKALEGEAVRRFMQADPVTVPANLSVRALVEDYVYRYHFKMFPVVEDGQLLGYVTTRSLKGLPRAEWERKTVREVVEPPTPDNTVPPDADALQALSRMSRTGASRLLVVEGEHLIGVLALKDLLRFLSLKVELEEEESG